MSINEFEIEFDNTPNEHEIEFEEKSNEHEIEMNNEIDPTVPEHVKKITKEDIEKWNNPDITDIELITEIVPESIEEDLEDNKVYNGNAIHDLAKLFGMTIEDLKKTIPNIKSEFDIEMEPKPEDVYNIIAIHQLMEIFGWEITQIQEAVSELLDKEDLIVTATFTLVTQKFDNISHYYDKIKKAHDSGRNVKLIVTIAENGNQAMADLSILDVTRNAAFFYPIMKTNIGNGLGEQIYFFDVKIAQSTGSLTPNVLQVIGFGE